MLCEMHSYCLYVSEAQNSTSEIALMYSLSVVDNGAIYTPSPRHMHAYIRRLQSQLKEINTRDPKQYEIKDKFSDHMPLMSKISALVQASSNNGLTYNVIGNSSYCTRSVIYLRVCLGCESEYVIIEAHILLITLFSGLICRVVQFILILMVVYFFLSVEIAAALREQRCAHTKCLQTKRSSCCLATQHMCVYHVHASPAPTMPRILQPSWHQTPHQRPLSLLPKPLELHNR